VHRIRFRFQFWFHFDRIWLAASLRWRISLQLAAFGLRADYNQWDCQIRRKTTRDESLILFLSLSCFFACDSCLSICRLAENRSNCCMYRIVYIDKHKLNYFCSILYITANLTDKLINYTIHTKLIKHKRNLIKVISIHTQCKMKFIWFQSKFLNSTKMCFILDRMNKIRLTKLYALLFYLYIFLSFSFSLSFNFTNTFFLLHLWFGISDLCVANSSLLS